MGGRYFTKSISAFLENCLTSRTNKMKLYNKDIHDYVTQFRYARFLARRCYFVYYRYCEYLISFMKVD